MSCWIWNYQGHLIVEVENGLLQDQGNYLDMVDLGCIKHGVFFFPHSRLVAVLDCTGLIKMEFTST